MKTVTQVARMTGISVRALHHYDAIGLLKPTCVTEAGYRLYDGEALRRLQTILLFRELEFPLKEIRAILDRPAFDPVQALDQQITLLEMKRDHLDALILHARNLKRMGGIPMDFKAFDTGKLDAYAAQAKKQWGATEAYREFEQKTEGKSGEQLKDAGTGLMDIFRELGAIRTADPASPEPQALVEKLQSYITDHFYTCTGSILRALGDMYAAGGEMTENIDKAGGEGTAEFAHQAIEIYCQ